MKSKDPTEEKSICSLNEINPTKDKVKATNPVNKETQERQTREHPGKTQSNRTDKQTSGKDYIYTQGNKRLVRLIRERQTEEGEDK